MNSARQALQLLLLKVAEYYGEEQSESRIEMWCEDLSDLPVEAVARAYRQLRRDPKVTRMPLPAKVREAIHPTLSERDEAMDVANRIIAALHRHGYVWPDTCRYDGKNWPQAFIEECGEAAWALVQHMGGFKKIHDEWNDTETNQNIFFAQLRDRAESFLKRAKLGLQNTPPALPYPESREQAKQLEGPQRLDAASLLKTVPVKIQGDNKK